MAVMTVNAEPDAWDETEPVAPQRLSREEKRRARARALIEDVEWLCRTGETALGIERRMGRKRSHICDRLRKISETDEEYAHDASVALQRLLVLTDDTRERLLSLQDRETRT